jgi:hypothetical protein
VNLTTWIKANAGPMIVGALFIMGGAGLFGLKISTDQGREIKRLAEQGAARDREAAVQRELQHECSLPAQPGQHKPEPRKHVHECWDSGLGAILTSMKRAVEASESTSSFIAGCLDPRGQCGRLAAEQREKEQAALQAKLDALRTQVNTAQEELLSRTTFVVTNSERPGDPPLIVRPIIAPAPCRALVGLQDVEIAQGILCSSGPR